MLWYLAGYQFVQDCSPASGGSSYGSKGFMEPPFREIDQLTQHHSRTRKNSGQLTYNSSGGSRGGSRGAKEPPFSATSLSIA